MPEQACPQQNPLCFHSGVAWGKDNSLHSSKIEPLNQIHKINVRQTSHAARASENSLIVLVVNFVYDNNPRLRSGYYDALKGKVRHR
jgi:hypothetical protein